MNQPAPTEMNSGQFQEIQALISQNPIISGFDLYYLGFLSHFTSQLSLKNIFTHVKNIISLYGDALITNEEKIEFLLRIVSKKTDFNLFRDLIPGSQDPEAETIKLLEEYFNQILKIIPMYQSISRFELFYLGRFHAIYPSQKILEIFQHVNNINILVSEDLIDEETQVDFLLKILNKKLKANKSKETTLNIPKDQEIRVKASPNSSMWKGTSSNNVDVKNEEESVKVENKSINKELHFEEIIQVKSSHSQNTIDAGAKTGKDKTKEGGKEIILETGKQKEQAAVSEKSRMVEESSRVAESKKAETNEIKNKIRKENREEEKEKSPQVQENLGPQNIRKETNFNKEKSSCNEENKKTKEKGREEGGSNEKGNNENKRDLSGERKKVNTGRKSLVPGQTEEKKAKGNIDKGIKGPEEKEWGSQGMDIEDRPNRKRAETVEMTASEDGDNSKGFSSTSTCGESGEKKKNKPGRKSVFLVSPRPLEVVKETPEEARNMQRTPGEESDEERKEFSLKKGKFQTQNNIENGDKPVSMKKQTSLKDLIKRTKKSARDEADETEDLLLTQEEQDSQILAPVESEMATQASSVSEKPLIVQWKKRRVMAAMEKQKNSGAHLDTQEAFEEENSRNEADKEDASEEEMNKFGKRRNLIESQEPRKKVKMDRPIEGIEESENKKGRYYKSDKMTSEGGNNPLRKSMLTNQLEEEAPKQTGKRSHVVKPQKDKGKKDNKDMEAPHGKGGNSLVNINPQLRAVYGNKGIDDLINRSDGSNKTVIAKSPRSIQENMIREGFESEQEGDHNKRNKQKKNSSENKEEKENAFGKVK